MLACSTNVPLAETAWRSAHPAKEEQGDIFTYLVFFCPLVPMFSSVTI